MWHSWSMENCFSKWLETSLESEVPSSRAGFAGSHAETLSEFPQFTWRIVIPAHNSQPKMRNSNLREVESNGPSEDLCKMKKTVATSYQQSLGLAAETSHSPHSLWCPSILFLKWQGKCTELTHRQLQLNNTWRGWKNTEGIVSLLPGSSGNSVAFSQGQGEYWSGSRISAKHFKVCWKLKRTYFYNSTLGIVNFSAKFLDRNNDFDCYISDISSGNSWEIIKEKNII